MTDGTDAGIAGLVTGGLVLLAILVLVAGIAIGAFASSAASPLGDDTDRSVDLGEVDPATARSSSDLSALERRLAGQISARIRSGALNLSSGQIAQARESLNGSRYESLLAEYGSVANETGRANRSRALLRLQRTQAEYTRLLDRYWKLHEAYENATYVGLTEALRNGSAAAVNRSRTRALAREMERTWRRVNETGVTLEARYENLTQVTSRNYTDAIESIAASRQNVSTAQRAVREREFVQTTLRGLPTRRQQISFAKPLEIRGRVETQAGAPIRNESLNVTVGDRRLTTRTNASGGFAIDYRPVGLRENATTVTLAFSPPNGSIYLGDSATLDVSITPVRPTLTTTVRPQTGGYGDNLTIETRIAVDGTGVPDAPVAVSVGGRFVVVNETGPDGVFRTEFTLPADIAAGSQPVRVRIAQRGRAIENASAVETVEIRREDTELTLQAEHAEGPRVSIAGELVQRDGAPVVDQRVTLRTNGSVVASTLTGPDGSFETLVVVPERLRRGGNRTTIDVNATFAGTGTNLSPSTASTTVVVPGGGPSLLPILVAALLVVVVGLVVARRFLDLPRVPDRRGGTPTGSDEPDAVDIIEAADESTSASLLEQATEQARNGRDAIAVQFGYAALRARLAPAVDDADSRTHWEFYRACRDSGLDERTLSTLRDLTELYERVTFAAGTVTDETATDALDRVRGIEVGGSD